MKYLATLLLCSSFNLCASEADWPDAQNQQSWQAKALQDGFKITPRTAYLAHSNYILGNRALDEYKKTQASDALETAVTHLNNAAVRLHPGAIDLILSLLFDPQIDLNFNPVRLPQGLRTDFYPLMSEDEILALGSAYRVNAILRSPLNTLLYSKKLLELTLETCGIEHDSKLSSIFMFIHKVLIGEKSSDSRNQALQEIGLTSEELTILVADALSRKDYPKLKILENVIGVLRACAEEDENEEEVARFNEIHHQIIGFTIAFAHSDTNGLVNFVNETQVTDPETGIECPVAYATDLIGENIITFGTLKTLFETAENMSGYTYRQSIISTYLMFLEWALFKNYPSFYLEENSDLEISPNSYPLFLETKYPKTNSTELNRHYLKRLIRGGFQTFNSSHGSKRAVSVIISINFRDLLPEITGDFATRSGLYTKTTKYLCHETQRKKDAQKFFKETFGSDIIEEILKSIEDRVVPFLLQMVAGEKDIWVKASYLDDIARLYLNLDNPAKTLEYYEQSFACHPDKDILEQIIRCCTDMELFEKGDAFIKQNAKLIKATKEGALKQSVINFNAAKFQKEKS